MKIGPKVHVPYILCPQGKCPRSYTCYIGRSSGPAETIMEIDNMCPSQKGREGKERKRAFRPGIVRFLVNDKHRTRRRIFSYLSWEQHRLVGTDVGGVCMEK